MFRCNWLRESDDSVSDQEEKTLQGRRWKTALVVIATAAAALTLTACGQSSSSVAAKPKHLTVVSYVTDFAPKGFYAPFVYAQDEGYYADEGINLRLSYGTGSATTAAEVGAGKADMGDVFGLNAAVAAGRGVPIKVVGEFHAQDALGIFTPKVGGATTISGLAGKSIVCAPGSAEATLLPGILKAAGISPSSVHILSASVALVQSIYVSGTGDGACDSMASAYEVNKVRPSNELPFSTVGFNTPSQAFIVNDSFLKAHAELVRGFLMATYKGMLGAKSHEAQAVADFEKVEPTLPKGSIVSNLNSWNAFTCSATMSKNHDLLGYNSTKQWAETLKIGKEYEGIPQSLTVGDFVTNEFFTGSSPVSTARCPF